MPGAFTISLSLSLFRSHSPRHVFYQLSCKKKKIEIRTPKHEIITENIQKIPTALIECVPRNFKEFNFLLFLEKDEIPAKKIE